VIGPVLITQLREAQIAAGVARSKVYDHTMYILAGLLLAGLACNLLVRPLAPHWFTTTEPARSGGGRTVATMPGGRATLALPLAWLAVALPLAWGFYMTILKAAALFR
jgi:hypothetical protein